MGHSTLVRAVTAALCATAMVGIAVAQDKAKAPAAAAKDDKVMAAHATYNLGDLKWGDAPPGLPKGAKVAVLNGDPGKA